MGLHCPRPTQYVIWEFFWTLNSCSSQVNYTLATCHLDYCNVLYVGLPLKSIPKLLLVQTAVVCIVLPKWRFVHVTPLLLELHWLPICVRVQFNVLVITFKGLHGLELGYLRYCLLGSSEQKDEVHDRSCLLRRYIF